jgi:hypothetical protein
MNTTNSNRFGIEIETIGLSRETLANVIARAIGGTPGLNSHYSPSVTMADGRVWNIARDASLSSSCNSGEIVSPILSYTDTDLETLQTIVRAVREAGARVDESCGVHIHVDGSRFDARGLINLVNMVHKNERLIERALGVSARRLISYTKPIDAEFVARLDARRPRTLAELQSAWYGQHGEVSRYDSTRYHGLNLNSLFFRGTVEFRYFNGTLHAGEIKSYVQLCLALVDRAQSAKATSRARRLIATENEKWAVRLLLKTLGMLGEEFKTARHHLTKNLTGNGANPRRAALRTRTEAA